MTDALVNSIVVAFLSSAVSVILGFLAAYSLARHRTTQWIFSWIIHKLGNR